MGPAGPRAFRVGEKVHVDTGRFGVGRGVVSWASRASGWVRVKVRLPDGDAVVRFNPGRRRSEGQYQLVPPSLGLDATAHLWDCSVEHVDELSEEEWLACTSPHLLVEHFRFQGQERKLRLFACACTRLDSKGMRKSAVRHAVDVAERYADGEAGQEELAAACAAAGPGSVADPKAFTAAWCSVLVVYYHPPAPVRRETFADRLRALRQAMGCTQQELTDRAELARFGVARLEQGLREPTEHTVQRLAEALGVGREDFTDGTGKLLSNRPHELQEERAGRTPPGQRRAEMKKQRHLALLRDVFGNPFRPVTLVPSMLRWNCEALPRMARKIYDERAFELLPIVADALQEAGCRDQQVLDHCRGSGEHVRGCFVIDLLLGRQ